MLFNAVGVLILVFLAPQWLTAFVNALSFPRLARRPGTESADAIQHLQQVSMLVPARNERDTLPDTLPLMLAQGAKEVIVLDDGSEDGTTEWLAAYAAAQPQLRVVQGSPLPEGWTGKNWACAQLSELAAGDMLLFTDADVTWEPGALAALVGLQARRDAGLTTVWPTQDTVTLIERIAVPQVDMILLGGLPYPLVRLLPFSSLAAANGQVMLWKRDAYARVGGHGSVAAEVLEDVRLAQRAKRLRVRLQLGLGSNRIHTRMYRSTEQVIEGFAKNILAASGSRAALLALVGLNLLAYALVWPLAFIDFRFALLGFLGIALRGLVAETSGRRFHEAWLQPFAPIVLTRIAARALSAGGRVTWRGRTYLNGKASP